MQHKQLLDDVISNDTVIMFDSVLFLRPLSKASWLNVKFDANETKGRQHIANTVVIASLDRMELTINNEWFVEAFPISQIAVFISFIDTFTNPFTSNTGVCSNSLCRKNVRNIDIDIDIECKDFIQMVVHGVLHSEARQGELFSFIQSLESYRISLFLLSFFLNAENDDEYNVKKASELYGLSESSFRKKCQHVYARGPKKQMRIWRAASSVLQLIDNEQSIVTIAFKNGYASSSHLASELKFFFGITPKDFKNLDGILHEHNFQ